MILSTERLILRPFEMSDAAALHALLQDPEIANGVLKVPHPYLEGMAEEWIQSRLSPPDDHYNFAITCDGLLIGAINMWVTPQHKRGGLGYWIGKAYWGQNYMTEAVGRIIQYGFEELDLNRIYAECFAFNIGSARVMEKNGMKREAYLRQAVLHRVSGELRDLIVYGILRCEYL